ncbi:MAG: aminotransferase class V-fold PLP-dependent enzyme [Rhodospirillales bacterium]
MTQAAKGQRKQTDPFERFRRGFPALREKTYLSICDKSILHDEVRAAVDVFLDHMAMASANRKDHEVRVLTAREKFARLMNVPVETVGTARNVSDGVNTVAWAMPMAEGDNVVVAVDAEHPNNIYPWLRQRRRGIELRIIDIKPDGALNIDGMIDAIDRRTRLMTCASVTFAPGHRTDVWRAGEACRAKDVFLLVDGVQSAGVLHHDLSSEPIDGFATSTSKGLLGLYGFGFLYVAPKWMDRLEPAYLSRPAVAHTDDDHSTMGALDYTLQPDGRRFDVGSYNIAGAYAVDAALDLLLDLGTRAIEDRVLSLAAALKDGMASAGLEPAVPIQDPGHSHIVTFGRLNAGGHGFSTDPRIGPIAQRLTERKVAHTIRRGQLRFGIHGYNNMSDIEYAIDCVRELARERVGA